MKPFSIIGREEHQDAQRELSEGLSSVVGAAGFDPDWTKKYRRYNRWYRRLWRWVQRKIDPSAYHNDEVFIVKALETSGSVMNGEPMECPGCGATLNPYGLPVPVWAAPYECVECGAEIR